MSLALSSEPAVPAAGQLRELQERIHALQGRRNRQGTHPVLPGLSPLFPAGLRGGAAYSLEAPLSVAMALLAGPSAEGHWCGAVGFPDFGAEAAAGYGVALDRLVLVPDPGADWPAAVGALLDVLPMVLVRPPSPVRPSEAARLGSRLRERSGVLLVMGPWPQSEGTLGVVGSHWEGLGQGHGHLWQHRVELALTQRGHTRTARADLAAPGLLPRSPWSGGAFRGGTPSPAAPQPRAGGAR